MGHFEKIYSASGLQEKDFVFSLFASNHLKKDFMCILANDRYEEGKSYSLYQQKSILRLLAVKSDLMTKDMLDKTYEQTHNNQLAIILDWFENRYSYILITIKEESCSQIFSDNYKNIIQSAQELVEESFS